MFYLFIICLFLSQQKLNTAQQILSGYILTTAFYNTLIFFFFFFFLLQYWTTRLTVMKIMSQCKEILMVPKQDSLSHTHTICIIYIYNLYFILYFLLFINLFIQPKIHKYLSTNSFNSNACVQLILSHRLLDLTAEDVDAEDLSVVVALGKGEAVALWRAVVAPNTDRGSCKWGSWQSQCWSEGPTADKIFKCKIL